MENIAVGFYNSTAPVVSGKTINAFNAGLNAGVLDSDLSGYDTGVATGVSFTLGSARSPDNNGRLAGATTLIQELNRQLAYASSLGPHTDYFTVPAGVTSCDVIVHACVSVYSNQVLTVNVNGAEVTGWDSIANTSGAVMTFTNVVPDGSNRINITFTDTDTTLPYVGINAYQLINIVEGGGGGGGHGLRLAGYRNRRIRS